MYAIATVVAAYVYFQYKHVLSIVLLTPVHVWWIVVRHFTSWQIAFV